VHERPLASGVPAAAGAGHGSGLAILSSILMAVLYHPGLEEPLRVYYGTDTPRRRPALRARALAMVWPSRRLSRRITLNARNTLDGLGVLGLLIIAIMVWQTEFRSSFLYQGRVRGPFALPP